ncbi:hypothetical protein FB451DRAFT_1372380, partial [Mycena latifolia]
MANSIPDSDKIGILPAIPKQQATGSNALTIMPFTQIITNCTAAFKSVVSADPVFHGLYEGSPTTFYCIPVQPQTPFIFAVYVGFTDDAEDYQVKSALFAKLIGDSEFMQMVKDDHSNITGDLKPELVIAIAIHWGTVSKCTVRRGGRYAASTATAHRVMIAPISKDHPTNLRLQKHIMAAGFVVDAHRYGEATPWFSGNVAHPVFMSCSECHGVDHYNESCPIINS